MKEIEILSHIQTLLEEEQWGTCLERGSPDNPHFQRVAVLLGEDYRDRENFLSIRAQKQPVDLENPSVGENFWRLQFDIKLPYSIKPTCAKEVASLLHFINRQLEVPGFEMDEINDQVYYRYVLLCVEEGIRKKLFLGVIGISMLILKLFNEAIEKVARGNITFDQLLQEVIELSKKIPTH